MTPVPTRRTPEPPGRVVATMHDLRDDDAARSFRSSAPVDARVYDEWTAEAEAEAVEALLAARSAPAPVPPEEITLEPSAEAPVRPTSRGAWVVLGLVGASALGLLAAGALAGFGAVIAGLSQAL